MTHLFRLWYSGALAECQRLIAHKNRDQLLRYVVGLSARNRAIFLQRYGLDGEPPKTAATLAEAFALSRSSINSIVDKTLGIIALRIDHDMQERIRLCMVNEPFW